MKRLFLGALAFLLVLKFGGGVISAAAELTGRAILGQ